MILVGDHCQLPAVCNCPNRLTQSICRDCHFTRCAHWDKAACHHLICSMRHASAPPFSSFLDMIRQGPIDQSTVDDMLQGCSITEEEVVCRASANIPILLSHCLQAAEYNQHVMHWLFPDTLQKSPLMGQLAIDQSSLNGSMQKAFMSCHALP